MLKLCFYLLSDIKSKIPIYYVWTTPKSHQYYLLIVHFDVCNIPSPCLYPNLSKIRLVTMGSSYFAEPLIFKQQNLAVFMNGAFTWQVVWQTLPILQIWPQSLNLIQSNFSSSVVIDVLLSSSFIVVNFENLVVPVTWRKRTKTTDCSILK